MRGWGVSDRMLLQVILNYLLLGAAMFPIYMRLDEHTFAHVIETTEELVTLVICWIAFWPVIGFFVVRNRLSSRFQRPDVREKVQMQ